MSWLVLLLLPALVLGFWWWRRLMLGRLATAVSADNPLMLAAYDQARASLPEAAALLARGEEVALSNSVGEIEHVWGVVHEFGEQSLEVSVVTQLISGPTPEGPMSVSRQVVEDWQAFLSDGSGIRGGFSTQAQLAICRNLKLPIPRALDQQGPEFLDTFIHPKKQTI